MKEINPVVQIPAIKDNGFCLAERLAIALILYTVRHRDWWPAFHCMHVLSKFLKLCSSAIMTYLVGKFNLPDHWYPSDLKKRAKIDEYLHWHHKFLRKGVVGIIYQKVDYLA